MAQPADTVITAAEPLARFEEARAVAVDPAGLIYVADAGADVVYRLRADGAVEAVLGGPGTGEGQFDKPSDVDPTNGLILVVADAGNSRLQRFSRQYQFLEALPVGTGAGRGPTFRSGEEAVLDRSKGEPVAVITSNTEDVFAVDAEQRVVLKWDRNRRLERVIGGAEEGDGALMNPVALAADARSLYVADRGRAGVLVYDLFGGFVRVLAEGRAQGVQGLAVFESRLWIVLPHRILVYHTRGRLEKVLDVALGAPLVDVAVQDGRLYLLTTTQLYRIRLPDN